MKKTLTKRIEDLEMNVRLLVGWYEKSKQHYTEQKNIGDTKIYCKCKEPSVCGFKRHDGNDICIQCGEYIKPREDWKNKEIEQRLLVMLRRIIIYGEKDATMESELYEYLRDKIT